MDIQLYNTEQGTGEPLILLHGNGESSDYFVHQMSYFSRYYRVIAVDTRGHGQSPRGTAPFTLQQFAVDLLRFLNCRDIGQAHILGFSDGGNIALLFALKYPRRVRSLILNGANLDPRGVKFPVQLPIILGYKIASLFAAKSPEAQRHAEILALMVREPHISPGQLTRLSCPTLVIAGTRDMIRASHTRLIYKSLPNAQLALIPGNHFIANKNPVAFNQAVEGFLKHHSGANETLCQRKGETL